MPVREFALLVLAVVVAAGLTLFAWITGVEFFLSIRYAPQHPGMFLAAQVIGAVGLLRFKLWGYVLYSLLTLGMAVACVLGLVLESQLDSAGGPPWIQYPTTLLMIAATLLAIRHGLNEGD